VSARLSSSVACEMLLGVAALLSGCSTTPTVPPATGETPESVAERMYEVHVEYQFVAAGTDMRLLARHPMRASTTTWSS